MLLFINFLFVHRNERNHNNLITISSSPNKTYIIYIFFIGMFLIFYTLQSYIIGFQFSWIPIIIFSDQMRRLFFDINIFYFVYYIFGITLRYTLLKKIPIKKLFFYLIPILTALFITLLSNNPYIYIILAIVVPILNGIIIMALTNIMMSFSHDKFRQHPLTLQDSIPTASLTE